LQGNIVNRALLYHPPKKWRTLSALALALILHLSAVALASHREMPLPDTPPESDVIGIDPGEDPPPQPLSPNASIPPPPSIPESEFIEPERQREAPPLRSNPPNRQPRQNPVAFVTNPRVLAVTTPRPEYPYEARRRHLTGSGICVLTIDSASGLVIDAAMEQAIGSEILDQSAIRAFKRWRFKPGSPGKLRIPITFLLTGASF
jgi:protein TonB